MTALTPITDHYSHSQFHPCGLQTKYHRQRIPQGPPSVAMAYGSALHKGLETWANKRIDNPGWSSADPKLETDAALDAAKAHFGQDLIRAAKKDEPVVFDAEPKLKKDGEPYANEQWNIQNSARVEAMLSMHIREFVKSNQAVVPAAAEYPFILNVTTPTGPREIWGVIDRVDSDETITDYKTAKVPWGAVKVEAAKAQAYIYQAAYRQIFDTQPKRFQFQVFSRGGPTIQTFEIPYDREAINQHVELVVKPQIASIEAGIFIPNTEGYWCSEKFCSWWTHCPLGAARWPEGRPFK